MGFPLCQPSYYANSLRKSFLPIYWDKVSAGSSLNKMQQCKTLSFINDLANTINIFEGVDSSYLYRYVEYLIIVMKVNKWPDLAAYSGCVLDSIHMVIKSCLVDKNAISLLINRIEINKDFGVYKLI